MAHHEHKNRANQINSEWVELAKQHGTPKRTKARGMWIANCLIWAGLWLFIGLFIWPMLFMVLVSLLMLLLPVGVTK